MRLLFITLAWAGCLLPYLASRRQQLLAKPLPKGLAWAGFVICVAAAVAALAMLYTPVSALLFTLVLVMCLWPVTVFLSAHLRQRPVLVSVLVFVAFSMIMLAESG